MKYTDNGCFHSVSVSRDEVEAFKQTWPCSGLPDRALWFQFDKRNGDLVDMRGVGEYDGADLLALSDDAKQFAFKMMAARQRAEKTEAQTPGLRAGSHWD